MKMPRVRKFKGFEEITISGTIKKMNDILIKKAILSFGKSLGIEPVANIKIIRNEK